ncbi:cystathionine beta-lyase [Acididesulfobacillus acetoxydans]|uniref:cysteine-S-conjugate beta-lyase n=1 Tax=Acididesulfobacillus acetoxydans TaxID=1561005 RepID=A0A8S0WG61_9FIRM|nr:MalY/PatB family protein [Acididesulfobacillus acetoxydans]CAA7601622.1 cystathionine beta-lyase [Acididesulfobacillus acetoxydans]CEJ07109.1 Cystathionine beta-lyase PatB [Acididesulfobacillus acetoxydans]
MDREFDRVVERRHTSSVKWDFNEETFGAKDVLPMWVADMDFLAPQAVIDALTRRAEHGIYGYSESMAGYYEAVREWMSKRHGWSIEKDWIVFSPGVVPALNWLIRALARPGAKVVIQPPIYPPFQRAIENNGCEPVHNPLKWEEGRYVMDMTGLEKEFAAGAQMLILCSPHNPVGRVWERAELEALAQLCQAYGVSVIADEIHSDLIYPGKEHVAYGTLSEKAAQQAVVCTAPSKTFNLAGLQTSNLIIPDPGRRQAFRKVMERNGIHHPNVFGLTALEAAYRQGGEWLDKLMLYLAENLGFLTDYLADKVPQVKVVRPEGTYLVWLDFRALGLEAEALQEFLLKSARVALNAGYTFGPGGAGFARMNIACPRVTLQEGLSRIARAVGELLTGQEQG